jgi:virginiamycin B lyase
MWFVEGTGVLGRITPAGTIAESVAVPSQFPGLGEMVMGPDGSLWFTESNSGRIGRFQPSAQQGSSCSAR